MESQMMFLDCPAYLAEEGAIRCGLPAEVRSRFTMRSTDGPLESAMIRCPSGHWFNAPVEFLTMKAGKEHNQGDSEAIHVGSGNSRANCAPAYYLGRPASLWISVMSRDRRRDSAVAGAGCLAAALAE
jgi:hypothetical protein